MNFIGGFSKWYESIENVYFWWEYCGTNQVTWWLQSNQ